MDKLLEGIKKGHINCINLSDKNLDFSLLKNNLSIKIDKIIMENNSENFILLQNENIKEVCLYGSDYTDFRVLKYVKQRIVNDRSKRIYKVKDLLWLCKNNLNLRCFRGNIDFNDYEDRHYDELWRVLKVRIKICEINNMAIRLPRDIENILNRNNMFRIDLIKKCLTLIGIRRFYCNYSHISELQGDALRLAQIPKEIVLQMAQNLFSLCYNEFLKDEELEFENFDKQQLQIERTNVEKMNRIQEINDAGAKFFN
jgi:hypothetical protein